MSSSQTALYTRIGTTDKLVGWLNVTDTSIDVPDKITVTDYHRGDIAGSRCAVLTNAEDAGSVRDKDVSNFVRYLARGLGEAASKPKAGKVQFGDQPYLLAASGSVLHLLIPGASRPAPAKTVAPTLPVTASGGGSSGAGGAGGSGGSGAGASSGAGGASASAGAAASAAALPFIAAQTAGDDLTSTPYDGDDIPEQVRSKRDYLFKDLGDLREDIHVDEVALYSVSPFWMADKISKLMLAMAGPDAVVTDGTACVGGNVINFARYFKAVNAVELSAQRARMLQHNVKVTGFSAKVTVRNDDYVRICTSLVQDVVFMDPPWGGPDYKSVPGALLDLFLGPHRFADVCLKVWPHTHYLALKLPVNFNLDGFVREVGGLPGSFQRVDLGGKALLVLIDCHANPKAGPAPAPAPAPASKKRARSESPT